MPSFPLSSTVRPWVHLLAQASQGDHGLAQFLGELGTELGLTGLVWCPLGQSAVLAPGVRGRDLVAEPRQRALERGGLWLSPRARGGLGPFQREGFHPTSPGVHPRGVLRVLAPLENLPPLAKMRDVADAVAAAQGWLKERREMRSQAAAWHLGLRSAALVHDLRNRLALISLQQQRFAMEQGQGAANRWNQEGQQLLEEARAMCAAFVPEPDALALPERLDLRPLLVRAATTAPRMVRNGDCGVGVRVRCRSDVSVFADPVLLARMLENLLVNALEASALGQTVELSAEQRAHKVAITVQDQGLGMDAHGLERAFAPGGGGGHGTGFGSVSLLAALKDLAGELWVDSAPGQGTRCVVLLELPRTDYSRLLVDPDLRRRGTTLGRWRQEGVEAMGVARASAAIRALGDWTPKSLYLARGLVDRRLQDLVRLARQLDCPVFVLGAEGNTRALDLSARVEVTPEYS